VGPQTLAAMRFAASGQARAGAVARPETRQGPGPDPCRGHRPDRRPPALRVPGDPGARASSGPDRCRSWAFGRLEPATGCGRARRLVTRPRGGSSLKQRGRSPVFQLNWGGPAIDSLRCSCVRVQSIAKMTECD
jgi:hypothetical protein